MRYFPEGYLTNNYGLNVGSIITERRFHPIIVDDEEGGHWEHREQSVYFKILEVSRNEYKCQYTDFENAEDFFYWPVWDHQPNHGFMPDGGTSVRYYIE